MFEQLQRQPSHQPHITPSTQQHKTQWVEISKQALLHNLQQYKNVLTPTTLLAPVIKSNAYGHGMLEVARIYQKSSLVDWLCVVSLSEAIALRENGITKPLLVLSIIDADLLYAVTHNITIVIYCQKSAATIEVHTCNF